METHALLRSALALGLCGCALLPESAQLRNPEGDKLVPQTALSTCPALQVVSREPVLAGTGLAVSSDGRFLATFIHTTAGAVIELRERETGQERRIDLEPPSLPAGVQWRIYEASFSPSGEWLAVSSVGIIWVLDVAGAKILYSIGADTPAQSYPGKFAWGDNHLAVSFWPPESYLADARAKKPVEVRLYDAASGKVEQKVAVPLASADAWTEVRLSPDGTWLAVLLRAQRWPGKADLLVFAADSGKEVWQQKISAEDLQWSVDGKHLLVLGNDLVWLDAANGKPVRRLDTDIHHSEYQKLRVSEGAHLAAGEFALYSAFKRVFREENRQTRLLVWQLDSGKTLCEARLDAATDAEIWITGTGEILTVETIYEVRPPLRLPKSARIVTYRRAPTIAPTKPAGAEKPANAQPKPPPHRVSF